MLDAIERDTAATVRYLIFLILAAACALGVVTAQAQVHSLGPPCPTGQVSQPVMQPDGTAKYGCGPAPYLAHSPADTTPAISCTQDSDCPPGPSRCQRGGFCGRSDMSCNADSDCKYSEFCDKSRPFHAPELLGTCAPRGGRY